MKHVRKHIQTHERTGSLMIVREGHLEIFCSRLKEGFLLVNIHENDYHDRSAEGKNGAFQAFVTALSNESCYASRRE